MTAQQRFMAFVSTIFAIVTMFCVACYLASQGKNIEAIGISGAITGLIGLAGVLAGGKGIQDNQDVTITNDRRDPVPVEEKK